MNIFDVLSIFDWITPTVGIAQDLYNDPTQANTWTFFIPFNNLPGGISCRDIEKLMDHHNIKRWGSQITDGQFFFCVPKDEARRAEWLLGRAGVPLARLSRGAPAPRPQTSFSNDLAQPGMTLVTTGRGLPGLLARLLGRLQ